MTAGSGLRTGGSYCVLALMLSSCGGGGGGGGTSQNQSPGTIQFSTTSVTFTAATSYAETPQDQTITGTVTGVSAGTLYFKIVENNPNIATVTGFTVTGNSGQASIVPASPSTLPAGKHQGSITVHACLNDATCGSGELTGSPQTIAVTYQIGSSVDGETMMPRVVPANTPGSVILRGSGFTGASGVSFGVTPASQVSVVSDTEIHASYPALAAGTYPVSINSGAIAFSGTLSVIDSPVFAPTFLSNPTQGAAAYSRMYFDAERNALLVILDSALLRYTFDGSTWSAPAQVTINGGLQQVSLSPDGTKLLALLSSATVTTSTVSMAELDPVTLVQTNITSTSYPSNDPPMLGAYGTFAYANDGNAIVSTTAAPGSVWVYGTVSRTWSVLYDTLNERLTPGSMAGSGDGSIVMIESQQYDASPGTAQFNPIQGNVDSSLSSTDLTGNEFATNGKVVDGKGQLLGAVAAGGGASGPDGVVINPAGTRLYAVETTATQLELHTFDLTAAPVNGVYPEIGTPVALDEDPRNLGYTQALIISPDGRTVFVQGPYGIAVQPVTP
jgi:hypothetical protein